MSRQYNDVVRDVCFRRSWVKFFNMFFKFRMFVSICRKVNLINLGKCTKVSHITFKLRMFVFFFSCRTLCQSNEMMPSTTTLTMYAFGCWWGLNSFIFHGNTFFEYRTTDVKLDTKQPNCLDTPPPEHQEKWVPNHRCVTMNIFVERGSRLSIWHEAIIR